jgi:hypothetical protein
MASIDKPTTTSSTAPLPQLKPPTPPVPTPEVAAAPVAPPAQGTAPLRDEFRMATKTGQLSPQSAQKEYDDLTAAMGKVRTADGATRLAERAQALATRVGAGEYGKVDRPFAKDLERLSRSATRAGEAVARFEALQDQLNGTPHDQAAATAGLLAKPLQFGADIRALKAFQGSPLLDDQKKAVDAIAKGATPEALARQLAADPDPKNYPAGTVAALAALRGVPDPKLQKALDKVGQTLLDQSAAARTENAEALAAQDEGNFLTRALNATKPVETVSDPLSLSAVKADPALGQLLAPMQASQDPATKAAVADVVKTWGQDALRASLKANETGSDDPKARAEKTITDFRAELEGLARTTGLGATLEATSQDALKGVAEGLLDDGSIGFEEMKANPAYGQLIGSLQADEAFKDRVNEKVLGMADDMLDDRLDGKEGEDELKDGIEDFQNDMKLLGETTGLGFADEATAEKFFEDRQGDFKKVVDEGRNALQKGLDKAGELVGKIGFIGDGAGWVWNQAGNLANAQLDLVGQGLGGLGWEGGENALDSVGNGIDTATNHVDSYLQGLGHGVAGIASGALYLVSHPVQSGKGVYAAVKDPGKAWDALLSDAKGGKDGSEAWAHGAGYLVANLLPAILSGGASAAGTTASVASKLGKFGGLANKLTGKLTGGKLDDFGRTLDGKHADPADALSDPKAFARNNADLRLRLKNALVAGESLNVVGALKALYGKNGKLPESIPAPVRKALETYDRVAPNSVITKQLKRVLSDKQIDKLRTGLKLNASLQTALAQEDFRRYVETQQKKLS